MTNKKKAAGSNMDNFKDGASLVGGAFADAASAIAASVSVAATDTSSAVMSTADKVGNSLGKARKQAARRVSGRHMTSSSVGRVSTRAAWSPRRRA